MKSTYLSRPRLGALVAVVVVLAIGNILSNRVLPPAFYAPTNVVVAAIVLALALAVADVTSADIGLRRWRDGARWGFAVVAAGALMYGIALVVPASRDLFYDARVYGGPGRLAYETLIRIPLGTVLLEEVAFRGVLPALFAAGRSRLQAALCASVLFGFWHVLPAFGLNEVNPVFEGVLGDGLAGQLAVVPFAVLGTTLLGLWMCFLRFRSGSLLTTMIAHVGSNSGAYLVSWVYGAGWLTGHLVAQ